MNTIGKQRLLSIAVIGGCGCLAAAQASAGDAFAKLLAAQAAAHISSHVGANPRPAAAHLDLTAPASPVNQNSHVEAESFPSANRHKLVNSEKPIPLAFNAVSNEPRPQSKAEQLARNFHRDGLPVAKLFQSQNTLLHLGLSPKGKPGLWLVEKLH